MLSGERVPRSKIIQSPLYTIGIVHQRSLGSLVEDARPECIKGLEAM